VNLRDARRAMWGRRMAGRRWAVKVKSEWGQRSRNVVVTIAPSSPASRPPHYVTAVSAVLAHVIMLALPQGLDFENGGQQAQIPL
jgi:hypothetical protein